MPILHAISTIFGIRTMQLQWGMVGGGSGDGVARQRPRAALRPRKDRQAQSDGRRVRSAKRRAVRRRYDVRRTAIRLRA